MLCDIKRINHIFYGLWPPFIPQWWNIFIFFRRIHRMDHIKLPSKDIMPNTTLIMLIRFVSCFCYVYWQSIFSWKLEEAGCGLLFSFIVVAVSFLCQLGEVMCWRIFLQVLHLCLLIISTCFILTEMILFTRLTSFHLSNYYSHLFITTCMRIHY